MEGCEPVDKTKIGRFLCMILRHKPQIIGIELDQYGWADVDQLIAGVRRYKEPGFDRAALDDIVATDSKQRYSYSEDCKRIRANQGHSIPVDVELPVAQPPEYLWHGTGEKYVESIDQMGLIPKGRLYVHLSADITTARTVGKRHGRPVIYKVHTGRMAQAGHVFYLSANGVWLTRDVPVWFLEKCE